jgi:RimJ/RimL family protein N-acetyltransferase
MNTRLALPGGHQALVLKTFPNVLELRTARTRLRAWRSDDLPAWVAMNADAEVRRWFPSILNEEQAGAEAARIRQSLAELGWGAWALEVPGVHRFAGFVGLIVPGWPAHFTPAVEIGWRLPRAAWGAGYASEAAQAVLAFAFQVLELQEVVSMTVPGNAASRRVMQRIGLQHRPQDDFDHPRVPPGHPFVRHVLYRMPREVFTESLRAPAQPGLDTMRPSL